ncbi:MAG TPA: VOC family protein [Dehalococcoidia bacterium]|nr:VOC family protein [Dehalococcoidia bacterium]
MNRRISVISIGVSDLGRSRAFYEDGLGFEARPESSDRAVFFQLQGAWLSLFARDRLAALAHVAPEGSGFQGVVLSHNVSTPEEVDAVLQQAVAAGGTLAVPPETSSFGRIGYFADPDGFLWEVAYTPKWPELSD